MSEPDPTQQAAAAPVGVTPSGPTAPWNQPGAAAHPARVGRYEVRSVLGEGGFGRVYQAYDAELGRDVAVKVPHAAGLTPALRERFLREARAAAKVHHPNVCPIYDVGTDGDVPYIVMRYIPGGTLEGLLGRRKGPPPPRFAVATARQLALGVAAAHAEGVVNRDLKPGNALWDEPRRQVVITDFGLAQVRGEAGLTKEGEWFGTPHYMSPEQWAGDVKTVGPLSDVYSLGVILYRLLTGEYPYSGMVLEIMAQAVGGNPRPPSAVRADLDPALDTVCLRAMAVDPAARYPSAKALADALSGYLKGADGGEDAEMPVGEPILDEAPRRGLPAGLTPASGFAAAAVPTRGVAPDPTPRSPRRAAPGTPAAAEASELVVCPRCRARMRVTPNRAKPVPCPMCKCLFSVGAGRQAAARAAGGEPVGTRTAEVRAAPVVYDLPDDEIPGGGPRPEWRPVTAGLMLAWIGPSVTLLFAGIMVVYLIAMAADRRGHAMAEYAPGQILLTLGAAAGMVLGGVGRWRAAVGPAGRLGGLCVLAGTTCLIAAYGIDMRSTWYGAVYLPGDPEIALRRLGNWFGMAALIAAEIAFYIELAGIGRRIPDFPHMHAATTRVLFLLMLVPAVVFAAFTGTADPVTDPSIQPPPWRVGGTLISGCGAMAFFPLWVLAALSLTARVALVVRKHARGR